MASVTVVELLQDTTEHKSHVWIEVQMGEHTLTIRVDPRTWEGYPDGFRVFLAADNEDDSNQPRLAGSSLSATIHYENKG